MPEAAAAAWRCWRITAVAMALLAASDHSY